MKQQVYILIFLLCSLLGCKDPYNPPEIRNFDELIVIDANVNGTTGQASVVLSKSKPLNATDTTIYISGAEVYLQSEGGVIYDLPSQDYGKYGADNVFLEYGDKIQLKVMINDERQYESEYEEFIKTPKIDSVTFEANDEGVQFFVSTHDPDNSSIYYKWEYFETWIFKSAFESGYVYETNSLGNLILGSITRRDPFEKDSMQFCFKDHLSTQIMLGTSENLSEDIISRKKLFYNSYADGRFKYKYSVLVKQNALTQRSYNYWSILNSNTEELGGIFDKQPSNFDSNIINVINPDEGVLGYFSVYSETEERIFIRSFDTPAHETSEALDDLCTDELLLVWDSELGYSPLSEDINYRYIVDSSDTASTVATDVCCDCRLSGYFETPDFWE